MDDETQLIEGNPYPGPRPFSPAEWRQFSGRTRETEDVRDLLLSYRAVLLYSQSGAGKSSLVAAGVLAGVERSRWLLGRVAGESVEPESGSNIHTANLLRTAGISIKAGAVATLEAQLARPDKRDVWFLILDQFEELFTAAPHLWPQREEFFKDLQRLVRADRNVHLLFVVREEYVAELDRFAEYVPENFRIRYRLERLRKEQARDAIVDPAGLAADRERAARMREAADEIVANLLEVPVQLPDGRVQKVAGEYLEPVHLQVVCRPMWERLGVDTAAVPFLDVADALGVYYDDVVRKTAHMNLWREFKLRRWFGRQLITPAGVRGIVDLDLATQTARGVSGTEIKQLEDEHIIRQVPRAGVPWYELTHDRFIPPIRDSNARFMRRWRERLMVWPFIGAMFIGFGALLFSLLQLYNENQRLQVTPVVTAGPDVAQREQAAVDIAMRVVAAAEPGRLLPEMLRASLSVYPYFDRIASAERIRDALQRSVNSAAANTGEVAGSRGMLPSEGGRLQAMSFSSDGATLAILEGPEPQRNREAPIVRPAGMVNIIRTDCFQVVGQFSSPDLLAGLAVSVDATGQRVALVHPSGALQMLGVSAEARSAEPRGPCVGSVPAQMTSNRGLAYRPGVLAMAFHPTRRLIATGTWDGATMLWDVSGRRLVAQLSGVGGRVWDVSFNPAGTVAATTHDGGTIRIWDLGSRRTIQTISTVQKVVRRVAFSPDGALLASAGWDNTVRLWNVNGGQPVRTLTGHSRPVNGVAFDRGGTRIVTGASDGVIKIWDARTGAIVRDLRGHTRAVRDVAFSPDGQRIGSAAADRTARIWDVGTGRLVATLSGHDRTPWSIAFNAAGTMAVTAGDDGTVRVWNARDGSQLKMLLMPVEANVATFADDDRFVIVASNDDSVRSIDWRTEQETLSFWGHRVADALVDAVLAADSSRLIAISDAGQLRLFDPATGQAASGQPSQSARHAVFSADGRRAATVAADGTTLIWDTRNWTRVSSLAAGQDPSGRRVALNADGSRVARLGERSVVISDVQSGSSITTADTSSPRGVDVALSPGGDLVAVTTVDGRLRTWSVATGVLLFDDPAVRAPNGRLAFTADGTQLHVAAMNGERVTYDPRRVREKDVAHLIGHAFRLLPGELDRALGLALEGDVDGAIGAIQRLPPESPDRQRADALQLLDRLRSGTFTPGQLQDYFSGVTAQPVR